MNKYLSLPYDEESLMDIHAGDQVFLSGTLYVGRDQVHLRLFDMINNGEEVPFDFKGNGIYYMGPSPAPEGHVIGACGPTTAQRMDPFAPFLMEKGLRLMVGKGPRKQPVYDAILKYKGLYLQAFGGCGALYSNATKKREIVAFPELGPEALLKLEIEDFPTICVYDSYGGHLI